jgi:tetratricopeptide (TPR) repeat protein
MEDFMSNDPEDLYDRITKALRQRDIGKAEELLVEYLKNNSEDTESRLLKSLIQMAKGDVLGAITPLEEILKYDSSNDSALHSLADYYYFTLNLNKAVEHCDKYLGVTGTRTSAVAIKVRRVKVQSLYAQGKFENALNEVDNLLKLNPKDERMIVYKARIFNSLGEYNLAKVLLLQNINKISDEALLGHAYYVLATSYHHLGQKDKSEELLLKSAELNDEFGTRWLKLRMAAELEKQLTLNKTKEK